MVAFRLLFHLFESCVVVGELVQVGKCDLSGDQRIVAGHVREDVAEAVLELDVQAAPELFDIESRGGPVDSDLLTDLARLVRGEAEPCRYDPPSLVKILWRVS